MLEKRCIEALLLTPDVVKIESQPLTLIFNVDGREFSYTPDLRVTLQDGGQALVEAKGAPFKKKFRDRLDAGLKAALQELRIPLYLVSSEQIDEERGARIAELRSLAKRTVPPDAIDALLDWFRTRSSPTVGDAEEAGFPLAHVAYAVGRRLLTVGPSFDLAPSQPLSTITAYEHIHLDYWLGYPGRSENVAA